MYMANPKVRLAIIGSGPSALYLIANMVQRIDQIRQHIYQIEVFEKGPVVGVGMPYSPLTTDIYNICNISSEELPSLFQSFDTWLKKCDETKLAGWGIERESISSSETYPRVALGEYFRSQWREAANRLQIAGLKFKEYADTEVVDMIDDEQSSTVRIITGTGKMMTCDRVVIATGHRFSESDRENAGYFTSPWPITKLLPPSGEKYRFTIGTLGASLSAFDVITSLAHRHGRFDERGKEPRFLLDGDAAGFRIVMHSAGGLLPHLQYEQREAFREIYRHVSRDEILALRNDLGFMRLDDYFDKICRPALVKAFKRDCRIEVGERLRDPRYTLEDFVEQMTDEHRHSDPFSGMVEELPEAERSVNANRPIHWKEVLDDLIYTLNYHAELLPAEDHLRFHSTVMSFLMNVIAALPLQSARKLLALRNAGVLDLVAGRVKTVDPREGKTIVTVNQGQETQLYEYSMFIDCTGQSPLTLDRYPFQSLVTSGTVRSAKAPFADASSIATLDESDRARLLDGPTPLIELAGIDIDGFSCVVSSSGKTNRRICDIAFPHMAGKRPYSYGLQACNDTAAIVVEYWIREDSQSSNADIFDVTEVYESVCDDCS